MLLQYIFEQIAFYFKVNIGTIYHGSKNVIAACMQATSTGFIAGSRETFSLKKGRHKKTDGIRSRDQGG